MSTPTDSLFAVLDVARNNGSIARAITQAGKAAVLEAGHRRFIEVNDGAFSVQWSVIHANSVQQRDNLHVQLTPAGADHLDGA